MDKPQTEFWKWCMAAVVGVSTLAGIVLFLAALYWMDKYFGPRPVLIALGIVIVVYWVALAKETFFK